MIRNIWPTFFLFFLLTACNKYSSPHESRPLNNSDSDSIFPVLYGVEATIDSPSPKIVSLDLTLDKNENIRRVKNIPGFDMLSKKDQTWLMNIFISMVPDSVSKQLRDRNDFPTHEVDTCTALNLGAATCPEVIVTYHLKCPAGLVFDEKSCQCTLPEKASEGSSNCYTMFHFSQSGNGYVKLKSGWWNLTAAPGNPNWCSVSGCTLHQ